MADIRINDLPNEDSPVASEKVAIDGATTRGTTIQKLVDSGAPVASQAEAETGSNNVKRMTPLRVKQSIASEVGTSIASAASGELAATAVQPGDLGTSAPLDVGTTAGTVAAGDDERFLPAALQITTSRNGMEAIEFQAGMNSLETRGFAMLNDGGGAHYVRVASEPTHGLKVRSVDRFLPDGSVDAVNGGWWEIDEPWFCAEMAGAVGVAGGDDGPALQRAVHAGAALNREVRVIGDLYLTSQIRCPSHTHIQGMGGTIYNQRANDLYLGGLFVSDNAATGGVGAPPISDISFVGLRVRDLVPPPQRCTLFAIVVCTGFVFRNNDIVKTSGLWTTFFSVNNAEITGNKVNSTAGDIYADCIHIMEGDNIRVVGNELWGQDDALALYSHSYAESAMANNITNVTILGNILRSTEAHALRIGHSGETYLPNSAEFYVENIVVSGNVMLGGVMLGDFRASVTKLGKSIQFSNCVIEEVVNLPTSVLAYDDITFSTCRIRASHLYNPASGTRTLNLETKAANVFKVLDCDLNWDGRGSDNNVAVGAAQRIDFSRNRIKGNAAGNGVSLIAPRVNVIENDIEMSAGFRSLWVNNGTSQVNRTKVVGNSIYGTATNGLVITNADFALVDDNDITTAGPYGMGTVAAGSGSLSGNGAPVATPPNSFEYFRRDGGAGSTRYLRQAGAWVAM